MICSHIKLIRKILGKKKKTDTILTLIKCKDCGHKWFECLETIAPKK